MYKDDLDERMKGYENISRYYLTKRMPLIIRIDGRAFHTFTRGFKRPFDSVLMHTMQDTALALCKNIEGCKLAYVQSDEISLLLTDYDNLNTNPWFEKNLQKIVSISASMATLYFNKKFRQHIFNISYPPASDPESIKENDEFIQSVYGFTPEETRTHEWWSEYFDKLQTANSKGAMFDARAFILPKEEVCNYFIWRQQDATRNSIQMVGQANFSHKELQNKSCNDIQEMLMTQKNINWNDFTVSQKRGACVTKTFEREVVVNFETDETTTRLGWGIDENIPIFTQDRNYIDKWVFI
jgi:tRNA(His) 5'-end guanylyltransferase